jgi:hypothetical protein
LAKNFKKGNRKNIVFEQSTLELIKIQLSFRQVRLLLWN